MGATNVGGVGLHLRGEVRGVFMDWLRQYRPDLVGRYEALYKRGAYLPAPERRRLAELAAGPDRPRRFLRPSAEEREASAARPEPDPAPAGQAALF